MDLTFLLKGIIMGFCVSAPVGPIGILCINRTLNKGYVAGLVSGLGATTADVVFAFIAGLGLNVVSTFLNDYKNWIHFVGLFFLIFIGIKTILKKPSKDENITNPESKGFWKDYITTFLLTFTNPLTIFFFIAVFAGLGISHLSAMAAIPLLIGVLIGSGSWWTFLCGITVQLKKKLSCKILEKIDLLSGILIIVFSLIIAIDLILKTM